MWTEYNPNPFGRHVGDCVIRAISKALNQTWDETYAGVALQGFIEKNMPSGNVIWGDYLKRKGFTRNVIPNDYENYTVEDFAKDHPRGTYILALSEHVVCVKNGIIYDTWKSGKEIPLYYWERVD